MMKSHHAMLITTHFRAKQDI